MNCRFGGHYLFSHLTGADFPNVIRKLLSNEKIDETTINMNSGIIESKDLVFVRLQ